MRLNGCIQVVCKTPFLASALALKAEPADQARRATIGYLVYKIPYRRVRAKLSCIYIKGKRLITLQNVVHVAHTYLYTRIVRYGLRGLKLYTRYPIVARALGRVRARAKISCMQGLKSRAHKGMQRVLILYGPYHNIF